MAKRLAKLAIVNDLHFRAVLIMGKLNIDADLLNSNEIPGFRAQNLLCNAAPTSTLEIQGIGSSSSPWWQIWIWGFDIESAIYFVFPVEIVEGIPSCTSYRNYIASYCVMYPISNL